MALDGINLFCRGRWNRKLELSQKVMSTPCATWSSISTAYRLIIGNLSGKLFVNSTRGSKDKERTQNTVTQCLILNFYIDLNWPCSNICIVHRFIIHVADIRAKFFVNNIRGSNDIERTPNTVIQCLILNCDLDIEQPLVKQRYCTSSHHSWHLCTVICKSNQEFYRYRADMKYSHTMFNLKFWPWPWTNLGQT